MAQQRKPPAKSVKEMFGVFDNLSEAERIRMTGLADMERMRANKNPDGLRLPANTPEMQVMQLETIYRIADMMGIRYDRSRAMEPDGMVNVVYDPMKMRIEVEAESTAGLTATLEDARRVPEWAEKPSDNSEVAQPATDTQTTEEAVQQYAAMSLKDAQEARHEARKQMKNARRKEKKRQSSAVIASREESPGPPPTSPAVGGSGSPEQLEVLAQVAKLE